MIKFPPKIKKYLPIILIVVALGILTSVILIVRSRNKVAPVGNDTGVAKEVTLSDRPIASLTPSTDGHWLTLGVDKIKIKAETMDYELLYQLPDGRTQGVPGTVDVKGKDNFKTDPLLLGSESSGRYRYDEGVEEGSLTLRFRDGKGKLIAKFSTKFHLQSGDKELTSVEKDFSYSFGRAPGKEFFVTMQTFGIPTDAPVEVTAGPFGIFTSSASAIPGKVTLGTASIYMADGGKWQKLDNGSASNVGIFIGTAE